MNTNDSSILEDLVQSTEVQSGQSGENFLRLKGRGKKAGKNSIRSNIDRLVVRRARHARLEIKYSIQENDDE